MSAATVHKRSPQEEIRGIFTALHNRGKGGVELESTRELFCQTFNRLNYRRNGRIAAGKKTSIQAGYNAISAFWEDVFGEDFPLGNDERIRVPRKVTVRGSPKDVRALAYAAVYVRSLDDVDLARLESELAKSRRVRIGGKGRHTPHITKADQHAMILAEYVQQSVYGKGRGLPRE